MGDAFLVAIKKAIVRKNARPVNQGSGSADRIAAPDISGNGTTISVAMTADNGAGDDNKNLQDVFVYAIYGGSAVMASVDSIGKQGHTDTLVEQGKK
jgi:hypothetical protein